MLEAVETDVMARLADAVAAARPRTPADTPHAAAAMSIANADETTAESDQVRAVVHDLVAGSMSPAPALPAARRRR